MQVRWNKGLDEQEKADLALQLAASTNVFKRLSVLIEEDISASSKHQESRDQYCSPSWAMAQADSIGEQRAYRKILRLINLKEK